MRPKDLVQRFVAEVLNGAGPARAEDLISNGAFLQRVSGFRRAFPDLRVTTLDLVAEGDLVAGHFTGSGTHEALFQGVPATGRRWEAHCTGLFRVQNDRIVDAWMNWDLLALMEQLGAIERVPTASA